MKKILLLFKNKKCVWGILAIIIFALIFNFLKREKQPPLPETAPLPESQNLYMENWPAPFLDLLPVETESFLIEYPAYDIYTVHLKGGNFDQAKREALDWFQNHGGVLKDLKIRWLTLSDEETIMKIASLLPVETKEYTIWFSAKMERFVVTVHQSPYLENKQKAINWFASQGLKDLKKINLFWAADPGVTDFEE